MEYLNATTKLMGNLQAAHGELLSGTLQERGRGFASDREAWAQLKECIEDIEERLKTIKNIHKDMWGAVKDRNEDAFCALASELQRSAMIMGQDWMRVGVLSNIAVLGEEAGE